MKIAMLAQAGSVHTERWCEALTVRGHHIRLISNSRSTSSNDEYETVTLPGKSSISYILNILTARKEISNFNPDIVHVHYATGFALWGILQNNAPLVVSVWGTDIVDAANKRFTIGPITRKALKRAAFVTATSRYLVNKTIQFEPSVANKIEQIPFSLPFSKNIEKLEKKKSSEIEFIFAKSFWPNYAPDLVLRAYASAYTKIVPSHLRLIGGGPMQDDLEKLAEDFGIKNKVTIEGWIEKTKAASYIAHADVLLMPSYQESFGVAALEAAAYGLPIIATNVGGVPEIVKDGISGILIEPGDESALAGAMVHLGNDFHVRKKMGAAGREYVRRHYAWDECLDKMEKVYQKILE